MFGNFYLWKLINDLGLQTADSKPKRKHKSKKEAEVATRAARLASMDERLREMVWNRRSRLGGLLWMRRWNLINGKAS